MCRRTAVWEVCNALTMLPTPALLWLLCASDAPTAWRLRAFSCAVAAQVPFSVAYHLREAARAYLEEDGCRIDNHWRRIDQTTQHLAQVAMTLAVSGSATYALASAPMHVLCIAQLWAAATSCDGRRWRGVAVGVLWYCAPMLRDGAWLWFAGAIAPMVVGALAAFVPPFKFEVPKSYTLVRTPLALP